MALRNIKGFESEIQKLRRKVHRQGHNFLKDIRELRQTIKSIREQSNHLRVKVKVIREIRQQALENRKLEMRLSRPKTKMSSTNIPSDTKVKQSMQRSSLESSSSNF